MSVISDAPRIKHLEFLQGVISRMGNTSLVVKGWTATIATSLLVVSIEQHSWPVAASSLPLVLVFWCLDGYYLRQERLFRRLYDAVRLAEETVEPMVMTPSRYRAQITWADATGSITPVAFYGTIVAVTLILGAIAALRA